MNILMLAEVSAVAVIGGAERVLREQALALRRRGHAVRLVTRAPVGDRRPTVEIDGIPEFRYDVNRGNEAAFVLSTLRRSIRRFDDCCRTAVPDAVLVHQPLVGLGPILRRRGRATWLYVCHSLAHEEYLSRTPAWSDPVRGMRRSLNARLRLMSERAVLRRCPRVVVLSEFMKRQAARAHGLRQERLVIVPGGADLHRFRPAADVVTVRRGLGLTDGTFVLFTVRNLVARMGLEPLIRAVGRLEQDGLDVLLLIGGDGPLRGALRQTITELGVGDRVRLLGFVAEEALSAYYQAADLVIMPTHEREGFGLVTVEALACGTPVLGTPVGALPEILTRVDPMLIAEGSDSRSLAAAISRLARHLGNPGERRRLSQRGRELVEADYHWAQHGESLEKVIEDARREAVGRRVAVADG